ncbi:Hemicentin-1 [Cricetulus griseus]|uniref:Hemicentin-1 n=1 Tax=Cricetulus griseus TaxID=10029 RepID=G3IN82_CRIGR|nr:Hemicentin-1 [Cricetulus griseus]
MPIPDIIWHKDGTLLAPSSEVVYSKGGRLLQLAKAQLSDAGLYTCQASNPAGITKKSTRLEVYVSPTIEGADGGPYLVQAVAGRPVALECVARGYPPPTISWQHEGLPLVDSNGTWLEAGGTLQLENPGEASGGLYSCVASSPAGEAVLQYSVEVQVPPRITLPPSLLGPVLLGTPFRLTCNATGTPSPTLIWLKDGNPVSPEGTPGLKVTGPWEPLTTVSVVQGGNTTLDCNATGKPLPVVTWERNGQPVRMEPGLWLQNQNRSLHVEQAQPSQAGGYSCVAENIAGRAEKRFTLSVLGHPPPKITWFKDGQSLAVGDTYEMSPDGTFLWVSQANLSSAGHYSCIAANAVGEKTKHAQLNVLVVPTILGAPENANEEVTVTINNPISLICEALAFPSPNITWMKDGVPFKASKNIQLLPGTHGLQILNAQKEDAGQYTCMVTNELGEATKNYHVEVLIPPSISKDDPLGEISVKKVKTKVNSTLTLECECWAVPPPSISWYKDGRPVTPSQRLHVLGEGRLLQIQPTQVSDSGRYLCVATNVSGEDDQDFNVLIQGDLTKAGDLSPFGS